MLLVLSLLPKYIPAAFRNIEPETKEPVLTTAIDDGRWPAKLVKSVAQTGVFKEPVISVTGSNAGMWVNVTNGPEISKGIVFTKQQN